MARICLLLLTIISISTSAYAQDTLLVETDIQLEKTVDGYFESLVECGLFSGAVLIARDGKVVVHKAYGKADYETNSPYETSTRSKLMSVTKAMTATTVMTLIADGKLDLNDTASKYLPDFPAKWKDVTLRQLLSHSSLIPNCESDWTQLEILRGGRGNELWPELAENLADRELISKAGYSNFNYILLGLIAEKVSGKHFQELVKEKIFEPAGMKQTGFDDGSRFDGLAMGYFAGKDGQPKMSGQDMSAIQAAGGVYSTVGDLYRFDRSLYDDRILPESIRAKMYEPTTEHFCQGWSIGPRHGHRCISHSGGANGYVADLLRFVDDNACVAVTSNFAFAPISTISNDVAGMLFGVPVQPAVVYSDDFLDKCQGAFTSPAATEHHSVVRRYGKSLMAFEYWPGIRRAPGKLLIPTDDGLFVGSSTSFQFRQSSANDRSELEEKRATYVFPMERRAVHDDGLSLLGTYKSDSNESATVTDDNGTIRLRSRDIFPPDMELFRLSPDLALGIYNDTGGIVVEIKQRFDERHILQWRKYDGSNIRIESSEQ